MKNADQQEGRESLRASAAPPGGRASAGAREVRIVAFPKEFQKDFWTSLDKRILIIWCACLVGVWGPLMYFAAQPKPATPTALSSRLLKRIGQINKIDPKLLEEIDKPKEEPKEDPASQAVTQQAQIKAPAGNVGKASKAAAAKAAAAARAAKAAKGVSGKGVLAVAGATGASGGKYAAVDFSGSSTGLDNVLGQIGSLGDAAGGDAKSQLGAGGVVGGEGGIGDLTSLLGDPGGLSVTAGAAGGGLIGVGKASVSGAGAGAVSAGDIQAVFVGNAAAINACYQKELKKSPDLKGKLSVAVKINPAGRVSGVTVTTNTVGAGVANCITSRIRGWSFPRGKRGTVTVNQTFVFTK